MEVIFMAAHILRDRRKGFHQENAMAGFTPERERRSVERRTGIERRGQGAQAMGGSGSKGIAEMLDPAGEEAYWRENYATQPYYQAGHTYDDYHPAYRAGWEGRARYEGRSFQEVERELRADYERRRGASRLGWDSSREAARAAWDRFDATDDFERSQ
jgi:hypothetical protein